jgi:hypothetical protein
MFRKNLLCIGLLAASMASGVFAQAPADTPPPAPAAQAEPSAQAPAKKQRAKGKHHRGKRNFESMKQRQAKQLATLKEKLKLAPEQEGAWNTFVEARQLPPPSPGPRMSRAEFAKLTTPERLELREKRRAERDAVMAKRTEAVRTFYAGLTPEQQKTFDAQSRRHLEPRKLHHRRHPAARAKG